MGATEKRWKFVVSFPGDNVYLREQTAAARAAAERLGVELQLLNAEMDPFRQSQQLLELVQARPETRPHGILLEPVSAIGLPRVAEAAVAAGIAWVVSNAPVDYIGGLRKKAKAPVFLISQNHAEIGRMQAQQIGAILPGGGSVLYLRGPAMNAVASKRFEGLESAKPRNVEIRGLKVQSTADSSYAAVRSWLSSGMAKPELTQMIVSQNADFLIGAREAFEGNTEEPARSKWLNLPRAGAGTRSQMKPLVDDGTLRAAVLTSLTMGTAIDMLVRAMQSGSQPPEKTFVEADSYPSLEALAKTPA
ncbi:MAG TPA: substrate-binding domain-containing protein [Verrucomicrobiae bacterium]|nr:substrate-binding domain-containing protein [Verrucomicrobiae bacterium]